MSGQKRGPGTTATNLRASRRILIGGALLIGAALANGDAVPTGTYLDMTAHLPVVDPARVTCPVLLIKGEYDGISMLEDLRDFFGRLPNGDRQPSIVAGAAQAVTFSRSYKAFHHVVQAFLAMPGAPAA